MPGDSVSLVDERVLIVAPTRRDADVTGALLRDARVHYRSCADMHELTVQLAAGVGAVLITDKSLIDPHVSIFVSAMASQPAWSDVPVLVLTQGREDSPASIPALAMLTNVTLLDRPVSTRSMVSAVLASLRARRRQYQMREQLAMQRRAEQALRDADRRKDEFLATLSHELRNPLAPIRTGLQVLARFPDDPVQSARLREMMERQLDQLIELVDDLLDLSRISTGRVVLRLERVDMRAIANAALEACQQIIEEAGHRVLAELPLTAVWVWADTQVDRTLDRSQGGLGVGLSLVRRLMNLHGGSVEAGSEGVDRGSTFTIRMPITTREPIDDAGPLSKSGSERIRSVRVLVVDDNVDAADSLATQLESNGHQTRTVYRGADALRAAAEFSPDIVFGDIGMPGMDGNEVASALRADPRSSSMILVALTDWGSEEDKRRTRNAGFDSHLVKPVSFETVDAVLSRL